MKSKDYYLISNLLSRHKCKRLAEVGQPGAWYPVVYLKMIDQDTFFSQGSCYKVDHALGLAIFTIP